MFCTPKFTSKWVESQTNEPKRQNKSSAGRKQACEKKKASK